MNTEKLRLLEVEGGMCPSAPYDASGDCTRLVIADRLIMTALCNRGHYIFAL